MRTVTYAPAEWNFSTSRCNLLSRQGDGNVALIIDRATIEQARKIQLYAEKMGLSVRYEGDPTSGRSPAGRPAVYPWGELEPGQTASIEVGRDRLKSARTAALQIAARNDWRIRTTYRDGRLYVTREQ